MILTEREENCYKIVNQVQEPLPKFGLFYRNKEAGVPADLVPRRFGPPGPNPLADLAPHGGPNLLADLVSIRGYSPLYFRDI